jgi:hypothetical protein
VGCGRLGERVRFAGKKRGFKGALPLVGKKSKNVKGVISVKVYEVGLMSKEGPDTMLIRRVRGLAENALEASEGARNIKRNVEELTYVKPLFELDWVRGVAKIVV